MLFLRRFSVVLGLFNLLLFSPLFAADSSIDPPSKYRVLNPETSSICAAGDLPCNGIYPVREKDACELALLTAGQKAFRARVWVINNAKVSLRHQNLIWTGDESGLALADLFK